MRMYKLVPEVVSMQQSVKSSRNYCTNLLPVWVRKQSCWNVTFERGWYKVCLGATSYPRENSVCRRRTSNSRRTQLYEIATVLAEKGACKELHKLEISLRLQTNSEVGVLRHLT